MADETSGGGEEVSVGDLVIHLRGEADGVAPQLESAVDSLTAVTAAADVANTHLKSFNSQTFTSMAAGLATVAGSTADAKEQLEEVNEQLIQMDAHVRALKSHETFQAFSLLRSQDDQKKRAAEFDKNWEAAEFAKHLQDERAQNQKIEEAKREHEAKVADIQRHAANVKLFEDESAFQKFLEAEQRTAVESGEIWNNLELTKSKARGGGGGGSGGGEGGEGEEDEHGNISHYTLRRIGFHAGQSVGAAGLGSDLTGILTAFEAFNPLEAAASVGAIALFGTMRAIKETNIEIVNSQISYNEELRKTSSHWMEIARQQTPNTSTGQLANSTIVEATNQAAEALIQKNAGLAEFNSSILNTQDHVERFAASFSRIGGAHGAYNTAEDTTFGISQAALDRKIVYAEQAQQRMGIWSKAMASIGLQRNREDREQAEAAAGIATLYEGPAKQQAQLALEIIQSRTALNRELADKKLTFVLASTEAHRSGQIAVEEADKDFTNPFNTNAQKIAASERAEAARARLKEIDAQNKVMGGIVDTNAAEARVNQTKIELEKRLALQREFEQNSLQSSYAYRNAEIANTTFGFAREVALLKEKHEQERQQRVMAGKGTSASDATADLEEKTQAAEHAYQMAQAELAIKLDIAIATRQITAAEAEWTKEAERLGHVEGMTNDEIEKRRTLFEHLKQVQADRSANDAVNDAYIAMLELNHAITEVEANYARLKLAHPEMSDQAAHAQTDAQNELKQKQLAKEQMEQLHPALKLMEAVKQIQAEVKAGALTNAQAGEVLKQKEFEIYGNQKAGQFNSSYVKGQVDIAAINKNGQFGAPDKLSEVGKALASIAGMIQQWVPLH